MPAIPPPHTLSNLFSGMQPMAAEIEIPAMMRNRQYIVVPNVDLVDERECINRHSAHYSINMLKKQ